MPQVDHATLARAKAQIEADPRFAQLMRGQGRGQAGGAIDPREFGVDYLPSGYKYSLGSGQIVDQSDYADWLFPAVAGAGMTLGATGLIPGFGGLAGGASQAPATATGGLLPNTSPVPLGAVALEPPGLAGAGGAAGGGGIGAAAGAGISGGASTAIDKIRQSLTDPGMYASLAPLLASLAMNSGGGGGMGAGSDELRRIQGITEARMRRVDPLHQVATQLAYSRAPIASRAGIPLTNVPLPE